MNSTKTCSLSRLEPIWQDLLHQATQSLLAQRSLPELMRALHQLSFSAIRFDRVNILRLIRCITASLCIATIHSKIG